MTSSHQFPPVPGTGDRFTSSRPVPTGSVPPLTGGRELVEGTGQTLTTHHPNPFDQFPSQGTGRQRCRWTPERLGPILRPIFDQILAALADGDWHDRQPIVTGLVDQGANPQTIEKLIREAGNHRILRRKKTRHGHQLRITTLGAEWLATR